MSGKPDAKQTYRGNAKKLTFDLATVGRSWETPARGLFSNSRTPRLACRRAIFSTPSHANAYFVDQKTDSVAMRGFLVLILLLIPAGYGCSGMSTWTSPPGPFSAPGGCNNPIIVPCNHPEFVWEQVVDVMDDYFKIKDEMPVRQIMGSEGELVTYPEVGSTLLEPWRHDSANFGERLECTLQTIRRQAVVRVKMVEGGYMIDVAVYKQLEDLARPQNAIAGRATFAYSSTQVGVIDPITDEPLELGWVPQGRDAALEQRILSDITDRLGMIPTR